MKHNSNQSFLDITDKNYKLVSTDSIQDWARKYISLPSVAFATSGPFNINISRYLIEPFNAIKDNETRIVICNSSIRSGKSLIYDISIPWWVIHRPSPIQLSMNTNAQVLNHIHNRLYRIMLNCKQMKGILPPESELTNTGIRFNNGCTLFTNGSSETNFQAKGIRFSICDEAGNGWSRGMLGQAISRTSDFERKGISKVLIVSQPDQKDSDFLTRYNSGTCEEWQVPCPACGKYFFPMWRQQKKDGKYFGMLWDESAKIDGRWNIKELVKTLRYECECGYKHIDSKELKKIWNAEGKYVITNLQADKTIRSFRWNAIPIDNWEFLVREFLEAKQLDDIGSTNNLIQFFQKYITREYDPSYYENIGNLKTEIYDVISDWDKAVVRFATIDVQKNSFYIVIREWAEDSSSRMLYAGQIVMESELLKIIETFKVPNNCVFVDVGNTEQGDVYMFVDRNKWTGFKGEGYNKSYPHIMNGNKVLKYYSLPQGIPLSINKRWWYWFNSTACSGILQSYRDGKGSMPWKCLDIPEHKKQMYAEQRKWIYSKYSGKGEYRWLNLKQLPNHFWDAEKMQICAALIHPKVNIIPPSYLVDGQNDDIDDNKLININQNPT